VEGWKWTDLQRVLRTLPPESPPVGITPGQGPFHGLAQERVFVNGRGPREPVRLDRDLAVRFVSDAEGTGHEARLRLEVPAGASVTLFESYEGRGAYFANTLIEITLGEGARLERLVRQHDSDAGVSVSTAEVRLAPAAVFSQTVLSSGARLQRHETHVHHPGAGAEVRLDGLYVLQGSAHADLTTVVIHEGPGGRTAELAKGVVAGEARGVFQGRITVLEGADQTDARMGHHALVLSDRAEVDAKPELEIWADDVQCAHGNTVGSLDRNALFYAMSRGMPEPDARALLTEAFLGEVVDRIQHEGGREAARVWLAQELGR
jgi:Fe-S cluster assembly protein SufD